MKESPEVVLPETDLMDVLMWSLGYPGTRECPCGCGETLRECNGSRLLVCHGAWRRAEPADKSAIMLPGVSASERREAARNVVAMAARIRAERKQHETMAAVPA
jgi:hypothetical protein